MPLKIHRKLTALYTIVFGMSLVLFIGFVCIGLIWGIYVDRTDEIQILAKEIAHEQREKIVQYIQSGSPPTEGSEEDNYDISGQVFYYIVDRSNKIIMADLPVPILREVAFAQISQWNTAKSAKVAIVTLPNGDKAMLALAEQKISHGNDLVATVYAGRDITGYFRVLLRSLFTLLASAFIFIIIASIAGYFLAGKVTLPIEQMINRQKRFVADASHELRNPLSVLLTSIEAIEMDKDTFLAPYSKRIVLNAKDELFRLKKLVTDLLTLARTDTGDIALKRERFLLEPVVKRVIRSLKGATEQKKSTIQLCITEPIELNGDPERIFQLFYILIDNAVKYSAANSQISVNLEKVYTEKPIAKIVVADNGPGIPREYQKQIFERFFRIDESRSRNIEGSGLGLSIAQWLVDAHDGQISVFSEPGKGSQFIVLIPCY
jgi:signal transduction histidine kinase